MSAPGLILREIHRLRKLVKDLDSRLEQGPRALRAHQNKIAQAEESLKQAQDILKYDKVKIHEKEVSVKAQQQQIAKLEKTEISNKKEYDALRAEIAVAQTTIRKLEDEMLDLMSESEEKTKLIPEAEKQVAKAKADATKFAQEHETRLTQLAAEKQTALAQLAEVEKSLSDEMRQVYERQAAARGEDALAGVEGRICVACYTEITAQMAHELALGMFVCCKNCGRILYSAP